MSTRELDAQRHSSVCPTVLARKKAKCNKIIAETRAMDDFITERFPTQWATPKGGDFAYWHLALEDTRKALTRWLEKDHPEAKQVD